MLAAGTAVAAIIGLSVAKYAEFDQQMSSTAAASMATAEEQRALGEAALEAGADTAYSATEAAAAQEELVKAGQSVTDVVGGSLNGALALAAAGQLQVARSAEIMATTLTQFGLTAEQSGHVADVLAAGAGKAQGSVDDLALALTYVGPLANAAHWSLEETAGTLAYFATQGILGEKAGTSLRGVLAALQAPSGAAAAVMEQYGISLYDANGGMVSASTLAGRLQTSLSGLTEEERNAALGRIFGNESLVAANLLYQGGAAAITNMTKQVNDYGYASVQAAKRQDNLAGDIEKLGGAFDTALIRTGSGANDVLRTMTQALTGLVDMYGELPAPVQQTALVLGVATGAMLLFAGATVGLRAKFIELKAQMDIANASMGRTALVGGAAGLALAGVVTIVALLAQAQAEAKARAEAYADALEAGGDAAEKFIAEQLAMKDSWLWIDRGSAIDNAKMLGISIEEVTQAVKGSSAEFDSFKERVQAAYETRGQGVEFGIAMQQLREKVEQLRTAQADAAETTKNTKEAQELLTEATGEGVPVTQTAAQAYIDAGGAVDDLNKQLSELIDKVMEANGVGQDAVSANIDYQDALRKVDEQIRNVAAGTEGYAYGLDITTEAGARNLDLLNSLAEQSQEAAEKQFQLDGNTENYRQTLEAGRQTLIDRAQQLGANADEAQGLADQIYRIPSDTEWTLIANTQDAAAKIGTIEAAIERLTGTKTVTIDMIAKYGPISPQFAATLPQANGGNVQFFAGGGAYGENHIAQFARAGTYRVWAEPETGGEWYLPDSPAKRSRSLQIAGQMLDGWGYDMVPRGAQASAAAAASGIQPGDRLALVVDGQTFDAYVQRQAGGVVSAAARAENARWAGGEKSL